MRPSHSLLSDQRCRTFLTSGAVNRRTEPLRPDRTCRSRNGRGRKEASASEDTPLPDRYGISSRLSASGRAYRLERSGRRDSNPANPPPPDYGSDSDTEHPRHRLGLPPARRLLEVPVDAARHVERRVPEMLGEPEDRPVVLDRDARERVPEANGMCASRRSGRRGRSRPLASPGTARGGGSPAGSGTRSSSRPAARASRRRACRTRPTTSRG